MSEPKGPFDTSLTVLRYGIGDGEDFEAAIRVLEDWPKWKPLIEAAGKVDGEQRLLTIFNNMIRESDVVWHEPAPESYEGFDPTPGDIRDHETWHEAINKIRALLEALPEED